MLIAFSLFSFLVLVFLAPALKPRIHARRNRTRANVNVTPAEHARLAQFYSARAQSWSQRSLNQQHIARQLRTRSRFSSTSPAASALSQCEFLTAHYRQRAARMQSLQHHHSQMARLASSFSRTTLTT